MADTEHTKARRTPEQKLAAAQLASQRAKGQMRYQYKRRAAARCNVVGRSLIAASVRDPEAKALLDRLVAGLTSPRDRALFEPPTKQPEKAFWPPESEAGGGTVPEPTESSDPPSESADELDRQMRAAGALYQSARRDGDTVAMQEHLKQSYIAMLRWEMVTQQLSPFRRASWERVPGSYKKATTA